VAPLGFSPEKAHVFDAGTGRALMHGVIPA